MARALDVVEEEVRRYDGETWFTVGHVAFPAEGPIQVGLHAIGNIDRTIYHGAYPEGTAIRFESFQLWQGGEQTPQVANCHIGGLAV